MVLCITLARFARSLWLKARLSRHSFKRTGSNVGIGGLHPARGL
jgi:hypothetical protein